MPTGLDRLLSLARRPKRGLTWTPRRLSGLLLWLASDYGVTKPGYGGVFVAASNHYLSRADNAALSSPGNASYWVSCWANFSALAATYYLVFKGTSTTAGQLEYGLLYNSGSSRLNFISGDTTAAGNRSAVANDVGAPSTSTWYHLFGYMDAGAADLVGLVTNGGTAQTATRLGRFPPDTNGAFFIGARSTSGTSASATIDQVMVGKSPTTDFATMAARLYGGGNGLRYADLSASERTAMGLVASWAIDEVSDASAPVTRVDAHGGNDVVDVAGKLVASTAGKVLGASASTDSDAVARWGDRSGQANHATQATVVNQPSYQTGIFGDLPSLRFGVDDYLTLTTALAFAGDFTLSFVTQGIATAGSTYASHSSGTGKVVQTDSDTLTLTDDAGNALAIDHSALDGGTHEVTLVRSGTTVTRYVDSAEDGSGTLAGTITLDRLGASANSLQGDLAEVIACDEANP